MKYLILILLILAVNSQRKLKDIPLNTFIGTGGYGFGIGANPVGAQTPYGMCRVGPDTSPQLPIFISFNHFGGYYYYDNHINMFSHVHMVGAGVVDYGWLGIIPTTLPKTDNYTQVLAERLQKRYGLRSRFSHKYETAEPGYYNVLLETYDILAEITATDHSAVHRYTYRQPTEQNVIIFDSSYSLGPKDCVNSSVQFDPKSQTVQGNIFAQGSLSSRFGGLTAYFNATIKNTSILSYGIFNTSGVYPNVTSASLCGSGFYVVIDKNVSEIFYGISFVNASQAYTNVLQETNFSSFDQVRNQTQTIWENELNRFQVSSPHRDDEVKFYSAIYHSMLSPTKWSEANGVYLGFDFNIHVKPSNMDHVYTDLSIWDTHRTQYPFLLFHDAKVQFDVVQSIMLVYQEADYLPKWQLGNGWTGCMIGSHADVVLADQITKNEIDSNLDLEQVMEALLKLANTVQPHDSRWNPEEYIKNKYAPYNMNGNSACDTLSYSYDDWAIHNVAVYMNKTDIAQDFYQRSQFYKNIFSNETKFFCPRYSTNGSFNCPQGIGYLNPFDTRYVEGDAWHYRYFVLQDPQGLIELMGGQEYYINTLEEFLNKSVYDPFRILPNPYYWAGNEEDLFSIYMFAYGGRADLAQKWSRWVLKNIYNTQADGLPGNDDYGTMSAWLAFSSLGFYPRAGCPEYVLSSPIFDSAKIVRKTLNGGNCTLNVIAHNNSEINQYIQYVQIGGQNITNYPYLDHNQYFKCQNGQTINLDFYMGSQPRPV